MHPVNPDPPSVSEKAAAGSPSMIRCLPRGICSWNYVLEGAGHRGTLELGSMSEQGSINVDGISLEVRKHGVFSGRWTLRHDGEEVASAQKSSAFTRTFEIQDPDGRLVLSAESSFRRSFQLARSSEVIATMRPDHAFTRRASIVIAANRWELPIIYFSFWLVVMMWRREAQSSNS